MKTGVLQWIPVRKTCYILGQPQLPLTKQSGAMRRLFKQCVYSNHCLSNPSLWLLAASEVYVQLWPPGTEKDIAVGNLVSHSNANGMCNWPLTCQYVLELE